MAGDIASRDEVICAVQPGRRRFLAVSALAVPALALHPAHAHASKAPRRLRFHHTHTGERLDVVYREGDRYLEDALAELNRFLRDFRTGDVHPINPLLMDTLHDAQRLIGRGATIEIISGYRSPRTNEMLRQRSAASGVAKQSLHMSGNAIDVRLTGIPTATLRDAARSLRAGGVGYYPGSDFVHLDTGRVRAW